jgi:transposase
MDRATLRAAKAQLVAVMLRGSSWQEASRSAGLPTSRTTAYRLLHRVRTEGAAALDDQRHGHPAKLRAPVQQWLTEFCRSTPASSGRTVQAALFGRFGIEVSISQINRLRAALGVRRSVPGEGKNQPPDSDKEPRWQEGAGSLLLLAAAQETGLLSALEEAIPTSEQVPLRLAHATPKTRRQGILTLLFLPAVGLRRIYDLRSYSGDATFAAHRSSPCLWLSPH